MAIKIEPISSESLNDGDSFVARVHTQFIVHGSAWSHILLSRHIDLIAYALGQHFTFSVSIFGQINKHLCCHAAH